MTALGVGLVTNATRDEIEALKALPIGEAAGQSDGAFERLNDVRDITKSLGGRP